MRIIGGKYRGKKLSPPANNKIRPTTDRMRETLFNILEHGSGPGIRGRRVLDLFAGSGALGIEALSREAEHVTFVDNHYNSIKLIKDNCALIGSPENITVISADCSKVTFRHEHYDLLFLDPPYRKSLLIPTLENILNQKCIKNNAIVVVEYASDEEIEFPDCFNEIKNKKMGEATFSILEYID